MPIRIVPGQDLWMRICGSLIGNGVLRSSLFATLLMQFVGHPFDPVGLYHGGCLVRKANRIRHFAVFQIVFDPLFNPGCRTIYFDVNCRRSYQLFTFRTPTGRTKMGSSINSKDHLKNHSATSTFIIINRHRTSLFFRTNRYWILDTCLILHDMLMRTLRIFIVRHPSTSIKYPLVSAEKLYQRNAVIYLKDIMLKSILQPSQVPHAFKISLKIRIFREFFQGRVNHGKHHGFFGRQASIDRGVVGNMI